MQPCNFKMPPHPSLPPLPTPPPWGRVPGDSAVALTALQAAADHVLIVRSGGAGHATLGGCWYTNRWYVQGADATSQCLQAFVHVARNSRHPTVKVFVNHVQMPFNAWRQICHSGRDCKASSQQADLPFVVFMCWPCHGGCHTDENHRLW